MESVIAQSLNHALRVTKPGLPLWTSRSMVVVLTRQSLLPQDLSERGKPFVFSWWQCFCLLPFGSPPREELWDELEVTASFCEQLPHLSFGLKRWPVPTHDKITDSFKSHTMWHVFRPHSSFTLAVFLPSGWKCHSAKLVPFFFNLLWVLPGESFALSFAKQGMVETISSVPHHCDMLGYFENKSIMSS